MELATAYVQIVPTTKGIKNNITNELNDQMAEAGHSSGLSWGNALGGVMKATLGVVTGAVATAGGAVVGLTKKAVDSYADYEQLVGGIETLFGGSTELFGTTAYKALENANKAYKTAGLSANEYMETVTGFSASLIQSLGGDTEKAVKYADRAIIDMSDNANKMGSSMESIQNAYQGFAKQNYTMLDNLKLGYGGTKQEMERLLKDATTLSGIEYDIESFADITEAIHVIQDNLEITGTTALEASTTISGSIASMKGAWQNLLTAMSDDNADFGRAVDDFVDTIVGEDGKGGVVGNLIPRIEKTLNGVGDLVTALAPVIAEKIPPMVTSTLPTLLKAVNSIIQALADNLPDLITSITAVIPDLMNTIVDTLLVLLPVLVDCALVLITALADGLSDSLPVLVPPVTEMILKITDTIVNNLPLLVESALKIVNALAMGLVEATPTLLDQGAKLIADFIASIDLQLAVIVDGGTRIMDNIITGLNNKMPEIKEVARSLPGKLKEKILETSVELTSVGTRLAVDLLAGFKTYFDNVLGDGNWVSNIVSNLINKILSAFNGAMSSIDWSSSVPSVTPTVNLFNGVTAQNNAVSGSVGAGAIIAGVDIKVKEDPKATTKVIASNAYKTSKASGIPSGILSKYG